MTVQLSESPIGDLQAAVLALPPGDPGDWALAQYEQAIPAMHRLANQLAGLQYVVLAGFDARGGGQVLGQRSTADWLAQQTRTTAAVAGAMVHTARSLRDDLPATAAALNAGDISEEHVRAIRRGQRRLGEAFVQAEAIVVDFARSRTAAETRALVDRLIQQYSPEDADDEAEIKHSRRRVHLSKSLDGWWHLDGLLDPATGEKLAAAFDVFAQRAADDDIRTPANRRCDALSEIAERATDDVDRPTGIGHVTLTMTPEQLESASGVSWPSGLLASRTDVGLQSCSAQVSYVVGFRTDDVHWEPLAVGFALRYATKAQRAALAVRDGAGCIHPGCTVPAHRCIAHHIRHWSDGGPTDLPNLVLICHYHHRRVHLGRLMIVVEDGRRTTRAPLRGPPLRL